MLLRNAKQLEGHALSARDGGIGEVKDFYFDDRHWHIRYCVVETGQWLHRRRVLISPAVMGDYNATLEMFRVDLTREQVGASRGVDAAKPTAAPASEMFTVEPGLTDGERPLKQRGEPFLRGVNDTIGYHIEASDGAIGHVEDFLVDDEDWRIRYLAIDTRNWWPGKKVIVAPAWVTGVSGEKRRITVDLTRNMIQNSPPYEPTTPWSEDYATALHAHYGREPETPRPQKT